MSENLSRDIESIRKAWDESAKRYDEWYETLRGAVEHHVDSVLLKEHLPASRDAKILDAAGGTGRMTVPLAKMGYSITLCDISPGMLDIAVQKLEREGLLERVDILECDISSLPFADESFDFVICWDGMIESPKELVRVTKRGGGRISIFLVNKYGAAIEEFRKDHSAALALLRSKSSRIIHHGEKHLVVSVEEARKLFEKEEIKVIEIYAVCGMLELLSIPEEVQKSRNWSAEFFEQVTEMSLRLSKEPSVKGVSRHLVLYGERI